MTTAQENAKVACDRLGLTIRAEFVPWSKSRNYKPNAKVGDMSLNWRVTLLVDGREILTTDYSAGIGHCLSYKQKFGGRFSLDEADAIKFECENGRMQTNLRRLKGGMSTPILSDVDVIYSLVSDSDVLNYSTYEEWAGNFGYDTDSRKGEAIYRACLEIALKLRNCLGESVLAELREAFQDY